MMSKFEACFNSSNFNSRRTILTKSIKLEKLLPSAISSIAVLVTVGLAAVSLEDNLTLYLAGISFVGTGAWLAAQGEIRSRMKQVSQRDERLEKYLSRQEMQDEKRNN